MMQSRRIQQIIVVIVVLVIVAVLVPLMLPGDSGPIRTAAIPVEALPVGVGRGFPIVALDQVDNGQSGMQAGSQAPNFQIVLDDGRYLQVADLVGRPVLINFWATWCGPCRLEMPEIVAEANRNDELIVLAVNVQEELTQLEPFAEDFQMTIPVVRDVAGELRDLYEVRGMPTSVFIDREGKIATVWTGILTGGALNEFLGKIQ